MADSKLIDQLQQATGKTREKCEKALTAANGNYDEAVAKLGGIGASRDQNQAHGQESSVAPAPRWQMR